VQLEHRRGSNVGAQVPTDAGHVHRCIYTRSKAQRNVQEEEEALAHPLSGAPLSTQIDTKYQHILTCTTKSTHTFGMIGLYLGALGCCQHACHVKPHLTLPNSLLFRSSPSRHAPSSGYFPSLPLGVMRRGGGEGVRWCASLLVCIFAGVHLFLSSDYDRHLSYPQLHSSSKINMS